MPLNTQAAELIRSRQGQEYTQFPLDRPGMITCSGTKLNGSTFIRCLIRKVSLCGAELEISPFLNIPNHFQLNFVGYSVHVSATLLVRNAERVKIEFNTLLDRNLMNRLRFEA